MNEQRGVYLEVNDNNQQIHKSGKAIWVNEQYKRNLTMRR